MKKKKILFLSLISATSIICATTLLLTNSKISMLDSYKELYGITFSSAKNKFFPGVGSTDYSGQAIVKTNGNNDIRFQYDSVAGGSSSTWHLIKENGYFYNVDPIHGLKSISFNFMESDREFRISWGYDHNFSLGSHILTSSPFTSFCNFDNEDPSFFKFENVSGGDLSIIDMVISLDCADYYHMLTLSSDDENKGTVEGGGGKKAGDSVTIVATANPGYSFSGWYDGELLISSNNSYTFNMPNYSLDYQAKFVQNYNIVAYSEDIEKGTVIAPSEWGEGLEVTISASSNDGYVFEYWRDENYNVLSSNAEYTFVMPNHDVEVVAVFVYGELLTLDSNFGSETVTLNGQGYHAKNRDVTITSTANENMVFDGWYDDKYKLVSNSNPYTFNFSKSTTLVAYYHYSSGAFHFSNISYTLNTCTLFGYDGTTPGDLSLPKLYQGKNVVSIDFEAFRNREYLTSIIIPYGYTSIGESAFAYCPSLKSVFISDSVTSIGYGAFSYCTSLDSLRLGNGLESIGELNFCGCSSLSDLNIPNSVTSIGHASFSRCTSLISLVIPDNVISIDYAAFNECYSLTSVVFGDGLTSIGQQAFYDCHSLISVTLGKNLASIGNYAFRLCNKLSLIINKSPLNIVPGSIADGYIADYANLVLSDGSESKLNLDNGFLTYNDDNEIYLLSYFGDESEIVVPSYVTTICDYAFKNCTSLTSVIIPDGVVSIRIGAFYNCSSLESVVIPESVTSLGDYLFYYCTSLTSTNIPHNVTSIGKYAFYHCSSLLSISVPNKVATIGDYAFYGCSSLNSIDIGESVVSIGQRAFYDCSALASLVIPDSVVSIELQAFYNCSSLASLVIGNNVDVINNGVFSRCSSLVSLVIPDSVTSIGVNAFSGCSSLVSITIPNSVISIGTYSFSNCSSLASIIIPISVTTIDAKAFSGCSSITFYCEASSKPSGWNYNWNSDKRPVVWGYTPE